MEETHIDNFIDNSEEDVYARWFFFLHRLPAIMQMEFSEFIRPLKLFCDYKGKKYRCTGASRLGDVWLAKDFYREIGYDLRVNVDECSRWSSI